MLEASLLRAGQALAYYAALKDGTWNAVVFVATVFVAHRSMNWASRSSPVIRRLVRGRPRALVRDGRVIDAALEHEGVTPRRGGLGPVRRNAGRLRMATAACAAVRPGPLGLRSVGLRTDAAGNRPDHRRSLHFSGVPR